MHWSSKLWPIHTRNSHYQLSAADLIGWQFPQSIARSQKSSLISQLQFTSTTEEQSNQSHSRLSIPLWRHSSLNLCPRSAFSTDVKIMSPEQCKNAEQLMKSPQIIPSLSVQGIYAAYVYWCIRTQIYPNKYSSSDDLDIFSKCPIHRPSQNYSCCFDLFCTFWLCHTLSDRPNGLERV